MRSKKNVYRFLYCFPIVIATNYQTHGGLKQFIPLQFWKTKVQSELSLGQNQGIGRATPPSWL